MAFCPRPPPPQCVTMGTSLSPLASKASSPSFGRHPAALSNGMFSAFGRAAVPQSVMGAEPDGPPKVSSSGSTLKSGFRASTTKMVLPSFLETKASNSSSLATPPFLADMVTTDAPRRVDTDLALRSATRQKGIVVALARRACIASSSVIEFIPFAQVSRSGRFSSSRQHFCLTCFVVRKVVAFAWCESYERQLDIRILLDNKSRQNRSIFGSQAPSFVDRFQAPTEHRGVTVRTAGIVGPLQNHGLQPRREDPGVPRIHSR